MTIITKNLTLAVAAGIFGLTALSWGASSYAATGKKAGWLPQLLEKAPVADPDTIPKNTSLWDAHKRGKLIYGGAKTQKLFSLTNPISGELEGFDATLAKLLAKYVTGNSKPETVLVTTATRESLLQNGSVDVVIYTYSNIGNRAELVDFAGPYFISGQSIATREATTDINSLDDLSGKSVCTTKGNSAYNIVMESVPNVKFVMMDTSTECETLLRQSRVDAEIQDRPLLLGQVEQGGLRLADGIFTTSPYQIGLPKESPEAVEFVEQWIALLVESGLWDEVFDNTLGKINGAHAADHKPMN